MSARFGSGALPGAAEAGVRNAGQRSDTLPARQARGNRMVLRAWRPVRKNALRGFAAVELPSGLTIVGIPIWVTRGKAWCSLPSKPVLDSEGRHVEVSGKKQYALVLRWRSRDLADRFSAAVVELIRRAQPDALGEAGP
jgi:hypothetical protein